MKKHILLLIILFVNILSYAQYDFLEESLKSFSTAPTYLVVKVKSPSYEGEALIENWSFYSYYETITKIEIKRADYVKLAYKDIKQGRCFIVSDEDFVIKYGQMQPYYFEKIIISDSVFEISKKGIEFFIRTYFDDKGIFNPPPQYKPSDFNTIVKVMFDAGIKTGIGCEWSYYEIQDKRFYVWNKEDDKANLIIPPEYRDSK